MLRTYLFVVLLFHIFCSCSNSEEYPVEKPTKLTSENFHKILSMNDPWIVVYTEGYSKEKEIELINLATSLVGMVQVGFVDIDDADCDDLVEVKRIKGPQIQVYLHGEVAKEKPIKVSSYNDAAQFALDSYPDKLDRITTVTLLPFYVRAMQESKPPKLPVVFFTEKDTVPPAMRCLALLFADIFSFSVMVQPPPETRANFSVTVLPHLMVMKHLDTETGEFQVVGYEREVFGQPTLSNLVRYLLTLQGDIGDKGHADTLNLKLNEGQEDSESLKTEIGVQELNGSVAQNICGSKMFGMCLIAVLAADDVEDVKAKEQIMDSVRKSKPINNRNIRYMWVNASCHPYFCQAFDIDQTQLPYVIVVDRSKSLYANFIGSFTFENLKEFLLSILSGKRKMFKFNKFPKFKRNICNQCKGDRCPTITERSKKRGPKMSKTRSEL